MRVVSETKYYKVLAKLYEKCASLSAQLDIYEFDSPKTEQFQQSEDSNENTQKRVQNKKKQKYIPHPIIKLEEEQQKQQPKYSSKNKKTISQNNVKSTKIQKKIKKPKNYDFSSSSSSTSSSYN
ncbi:unnamed protein product [Paramecium octaurelia]|uniref:Uncharacterized protein n=1 Tax=Paramecium octaurelia TaxID=43137 RepID=A0A8S1WQC4_PAROT|nr:unnamed protein product [Paramecium octaurelia]